MLVALGLSATMNAGVIYDNGTPTGDTGRCDTNQQQCGDSGWTVADHFSLSSGATVTGFTYNDYPGGGGGYTGTAWNIWNGDPFGGGTLITSGLAVGVVSAGASGSQLVTITGLSVPLSANTYWLGIQTQLDTVATTWSRARVTGGSGTFEQWSGPADGGGVGHYQFPLTGVTAFSVEGDATGTPEPATFGLGGLALVALAALRRRFA
jgi:MYXO-CTERM domain-containing protein